MIAPIRQEYNERFSKERYQHFLADIEKQYPGQLDFRIAETPIYIPKDFIQNALAACEAIIDRVQQPDYKALSDRAIPVKLNTPNEDGQPQFLAFDFGICTNASGEFEPQLIEMQAFPSLFAWQIELSEIHAQHFYTPDGFSTYLNGFDRKEYVTLLKKIIIGDAAPENVVLLEIFPQQQKTRIDFVATEKMLGVKTVCLTQLIKEGKELFYESEGRKIKIERIYNRLIFDDLGQQTTEVQEKGKILQQELNVTWVPHPNWFYRLSKFTLPFIQHPFVPETYFLNQVDPLPDDLENYVVKPLFSFAGQGVIIDVTKDAIEKISDSENWILQRKVNYAPAIETPDGPAKAELRIFYFWEDASQRPIATNNLARLSKGKMVGVRYNKDKTWVGGSFCLFEQ